jgi:endonuclease/exonuclease/phosphatase family metal-dependent hydrolase
LWKWRFGNAVLSKYPITDARIVDLPGYSTWETILAGKKRGVVCDIRLEDQVIHVIGAHLSHRSEALRVASAARLVDMASASRLPTIIAGDLNSTPSGFPHSMEDPNRNNAMDTLAQSGRFKRSPTSLPLTDNDLTYHSTVPAAVIDWVLIPPHWKFLQYRVELSQLSDHRPVYADVALDVSAAISADE